MAPNIYYLGAANVIQLGPLKIAAMSGIWAGRDYRKPHFERLPYNDNTMRSIYHQRELDARKLLAYRNQVDIGMSHDWPHEIWKDGNHQALFRYKKFFQADAEKGLLGSKAATLLLDRLRPFYWFSAHLHAKYTAYRNHEKAHDGRDVTQKSGLMSLEAYMQSQSPVQAEAAHAGIEVEDQPMQDAHDATRASAVSAWSNFSQSVEADDAKVHNAAQATREEQLAQNGVPLAAKYNFEETFKPVSVADNGGALDRQSAQAQDHLVPQIPQYDGTCLSMPKRRRQSSPSDETQQQARPRDSEPPDNRNEPTRVTNPDAIDVNLSDSEDDSSTKPMLSKDAVPSQQAPAVTIQPAVRAMKEEIDPVTPNRNDAAHDTTSDEVVREEVSLPTDNMQDTAAAPQIDDAAVANIADEIPEHLRAELEAMSTNFAPKKEEERSPDLPFPENITNKGTRFLALSKPERDRDFEFLQLMEIKPYNDVEKSKSLKRPLKLQYDHEWLAILRAFASELEYGGSEDDQVQPHRGDTYYRDEITKEEEWVKENIVDKGLLQVPETFVVTTEDDQDGAESIKEADMPREQTNPQTVAFCELIGIENKFDFSEADRDARMAAGAPASKGRGQGHRTGQHHNNRGGGHRGGRGRGRGGRGRGRNRY